MASLNIATDLKNLIKRIIYDECYPVGSIYISMNSTSPAIRFGGTWVQITDKFLYCTKSSKKTGGSTTTKSHTLTVEQIPSHRHWTREIAPGLYTGWGNKSQDGWVTQALHQNNGGTWDTADTGGGRGHSHGQNLPPYITCYAWYRTA